MAISIDINTQAAQKQVKDLADSFTYMSGQLIETEADLKSFQKFLEETGYDAKSASTAVKYLGEQYGILGTKLDKATKAQKRHNDETDKAQRSLKKFTGTVSTGFKKLDSAVQSTSKSFFTLKTAVAALGLGRFAKSIFDVGTQADAMSRAMIVATGSMQAAAEAEQFLVEQTERLGLFLPEQIHSFNQLAGATRNSALEGAATRNIWLGIAEAGAALNLSNDQIQRSMRAVVQMFSKGKLQAEELRGQLGEHIPGALRILAEELGLTQEELSKMMADGELYADDILPRLGDALRRNFGDAAEEAANTGVRELNRLKTAWWQFLRVIADSGAYSAAADGLRLLTKGVKDVTAAVNTVRLDNAAADVNKYRGEVEALIPWVAYWKKIVEESGGENKAAQEKLDEHTAALEANNAKLKEAETRYNDLYDSIYKTNKVTADSTANIKSYSSARASATRVIAEGHEKERKAQEDAVKEREKAARAQAKLDKQILQGVQDRINLYANADKADAERMKNLEQRLKDLKRVQAEADFASTKDYLQTEIDAVKKQLDELIKKTEQLNKAREYRDWIAIEREGMKAYEDQKTAVDELVEAKNALLAQDKLMKDNPALSEKNISDVEKMKAKIKDLGLETEAAMDKGMEASKKAREEIKKAKEEVGIFGEAAREAGDAIVDALGETVRAGLHGSWNDIDDIFKEQFMDALVDIAAETAEELIRLLGAGLLNGLKGEWGKGGGLFGGLASKLFGGFGAEGGEESAKSWLGGLGKGIAAGAAKAKAWFGGLFGGGGGGSIGTSAAGNVGAAMGSEASAAMGATVAAEAPAAMSSGLLMASKAIPAVAIAAVGAKIVSKWFEPGGMFGGKSARQKAEDQMYDYYDAMKQAAADGNEELAAEMGANYQAMMEQLTTSGFDSDYYDKLQAAMQESGFGTRHQMEEAGIDPSDIIPDDFGQVIADRYGSALDGVEFDQFKQRFENTLAETGGVLSDDDKQYAIDFVTKYSGDIPMEDLRAFLEGQGLDQQTVNQILGTVEADEAFKSLLAEGVPPGEALAQLQTEGLTPSEDLLATVEEGVMPGEELASLSAEGLEAADDLADIAKEGVPPSSELSDVEMEPSGELVDMEMEASGDLSHLARAGLDAEGDSTLRSLAKGVKPSARLLDIYRKGIPTRPGSAMGGVLKYATGGWLQKHPNGGIIREGSGKVDDVLLGKLNGMMHYGMGKEYVVNQRATANNFALIDHINRTQSDFLGGLQKAKGYAAGGMIGGHPTAAYQKTDKVIHLKVPITIVLPDGTVVQQETIDAIFDQLMSRSSLGEVMVDSRGILQRIK